MGWLRASWAGLGALAGVLLATPATALPPLQPLVDATPPGGVLRPPPGVYAGPVVLRRAMVLDGAGVVTVDNEGRGTVVRIETDGASVRGLRLVGSGESHDGLDAGVQVRGDGNTIADNDIEDCLFGVDLQDAHRNHVRGNRIRSKPVDLGIRGDGVRLWYSRDNQIVDNDIHDVRDVVVWYSGENLIARNRVSRSRYALHFMYSERNVVEENVYSDNMVGVFLMYSDGVELRNNRIVNSAGPTGMGVGFKESSNVLLEGNSVLHCARGIYLDISPYEPDTTNRFLANRIAYNGIGVMFHSDWHGNVFRGNDFVGNLTQVAVRGGGGANRHEWSDNYWEDFRGFDRDRDGQGDAPYEIFAFADRLWMMVPPLRFFRASPVLEALDFLERLAPFTEPQLILRDPAPRMRPHWVESS